jgi:hypothetical protein
MKLDGSATDEPIDRIALALYCISLDDESEPSIMLEGSANIANWEDGRHALEGGHGGILAQAGRAKAWIQAGEERLAQGAVERVGLFLAGSG